MLNCGRHIIRKMVSQVQKKLNNSTAEAGAVPPITVRNTLPNGDTNLLKPGQRALNWYVCGPTVYAPSHLGHARTYVAFDTIRRILTDYFGLHVNFCMNITDVEDKIIKRTRENFFRAEFEEKHGADLETAKTRITKSFKDAIAKGEGEIKKQADELAKAEQRYQKDLTTQLNETKAKHKVLTDNWKRVEKLIASKASAKELIAEGGEVLGSSLDKELAPTTAFSNEQFRAHAERYETEYLDDMRAMNVRDADVLTRVTEYIPEIITYVEKIVANGDGYAAPPNEDGNSSVYFNVDHFDKAKKRYAELRPECVGNESILNAGEGALSGPATEKKSNKDFVLWKASKLGEPAWDSPWGKGRPGWHIECSAMASSILGMELDMHSGGEDLAFPHHVNECAQAESFYSNPDEGYYHCRWCRVWIHSGHLHINGCKMSKSLKNFIVIRQMLNAFSMQQIRIMFLLAKWDSQMNVDWNDSKGTVAEAKRKEQQFREFFLTVRAHERKLAELPVLCSQHQKWDDEDRKLNDSLMDCMTKVDLALRDAFNYPLAVGELNGVVNSANIYLRKRREEGSEPKILLLKKTAVYVNRILGCLGVIRDGEEHFLGKKFFAREKALAPVLDVLVEYRDQVRRALKDFNFKKVTLLGNSLAPKFERVDNVLKSGSKVMAASHPAEPQDATRERQKVLDAAFNMADKLKALVSNADTSDKAAKVRLMKAAMSECDTPRDVDLPEVGVRIEDPQKDESPIWKLYDPEYLKAQSAEQARAKLDNKLKELQRQQDQLQSKKMTVQQYFEQDGFTKFGDGGLPTHDQEGNELAKSKKKKLSKLAKAQKKKHDAYLKELASKPNMEADLQQEIADYESKIQAVDEETGIADLA